MALIFSKQADYCTFQVIRWLKSFERDLELNLLIDTKNQVVITNPVGGEVFVNKHSYTELGG